MQKRTLDDIAEEVITVSKGIGTDYGMFRVRRYAVLTEFSEQEIINAVKRKLSEIKTMTTIAEDLPKEQQRCREILESAVSIGKAGAFLAALLRESLRKAEAASSSGDVVEMMRCYEDLKNYKE